MEGEGRDSGDEGKPVPSMKDKERAEKLWSMLEAGAWLSGALLILYFSELFRVLRLSQLIAHPWWEACIILFVFNCLLVAYFAIWVARVKKQKYMDYAPRLIYVLTVSGLLCGLCFIVALWPVYGIGAPIILAVLFMSFITLPELLPFLP